MLFLLLFTVAAVGAVVYAVWPAVKNALGEGDQPSKTSADTGTTRHVSESLEGALVAQLATDAITRRQYIHAMEGLAAREDARNPLAVPPETDSAA